MPVDTRDTPEISVVIPVYRNRETLVELLDRLDAALAGERAEYVFVVDGSPDDSLEILLAELPRRPRLVVIELERNFGQHAALCAGFAAARGAVAMVLDADLQLPPEELPRFVECWRDGHDFVGGRRRKRHDPLTRRIGSWAMSHLVHRLVGGRISDWGCPIAAIDREILARIPECGEQRRFLKPLMAQLARRPAELPVDAQRVGGKSSYTFLALVFLALDFVVAFARRPFQRLAALGFLMLGVGVLGGALYFVLRFAGAGPMLKVQVAIFITTILGFQVLILGALGEYTHRTYQLVQGRPFFEVRARHAAADVSAEQADAASR